MLPPLTRRVERSLRQSICSSYRQKGAFQRLEPVTALFAALSAKKEFVSYEYPIHEGIAIRGDYYYRLDYHYFVYSSHTKQASFIL